MTRRVRERSGRFIERECEWVALVRTARVKVNALFRNLFFLGGTVGAVELENLWTRCGN